MVLTLILALAGGNGQFCIRDLGWMCDFLQSERRLTGQSEFESARSRTTWTSVRTATPVPPLGV